MKALLDTHAFLWWITDNPLLSSGARAVIESPDNAIFFSAASGWEIATKVGIGKLPLPGPPNIFIPQQLNLNNITALSIEMQHALHVHTLPMHHRDPFDRILIAQSQLENMPIITSDPLIVQYNVKTIW